MLPPVKRRSPIAEDISKFFDVDAVVVTAVVVVVAAVAVVVVVIYI